LPTALASSKHLSPCGILTIKSFSTGNDTASHVVAATRTVTTHDDYHPQPDHPPPNENTNNTPISSNHSYLRSSSLSLLSTYVDPSHDHDHDHDHEATALLPVDDADVDSINGLGFPFFFRGVTFDRTVDKVADGVALQLTFGNNGNKHCAVTDKYGDTECKFHWGQDMEGTLDALALPFDLTATDMYQIIGNFTVDGSVPLNFECDVCGSPCTLQVPVIDETLTVAFPACPISSKGFVHAIGEPLPPKAYIPETIISGTVRVLKKKKKKLQSQQQQSQREALEDDDAYDKSADVLLKAEATIKIHW
jgi:hypothetical protein